jgi:hypothetical protein
MQTLMLICLLVLLLLIQLLLTIMILLGHSSKEIVTAPASYRWSLLRQTFYAE